MKRKQVWQYSCDFCGKRMYSAASMSTHEKRCTLNPNRECAMCRLFGNGKHDLTDLRATMPVADVARIAWPKVCCRFDGDHNGVPTPEYIAVEQYRAWIGAEVAKQLPALIEASEGCPACILAVIRLNHIAPVTEWKFKAARDEAMKNHNDAEQQNHEGY
jgi:hypothetical protein